jgi:diguanylate cyclase (GGDEF)-like protein
LEVTDPSLLLLHEDVGETYDAVVKSAAAAVGAESCDLALHDEQTGELIARRPRYAAPGRGVPRYRFAPAPASARVLQTGEPYISNDASADPLYEPSVRERGVRSILTVPVRRGNRILGLLYAVNRPGGFTAEHAQTLLALAGAAAVTMENVRLYAVEREQRVLNESLREVSRAIVTTPSEDAALASVLDQMWRVVRYQGAAALVLEGATVRVAAARGGDSDLELRLDDFPSLRQALNERRAVPLANAATLLPALGLRGFHGHALAAPLLSRGVCLGAFVVAFESDHAPRPLDLQLASAFADHAALFLEVGSVLRRERLARARASAVTRVTRLSVTRHEPESLLQAAAPELLAVSGADRVVLYLRHPQNPVLAPVADAGTLPAEAERVRELRLDLASSTLAALADRGSVLFQGDDSPPGTLTPHDDTRTLLVLALPCREELVGAVSFASVGRDWHVDAGLVEFLGDVCRQVALGVDNARLFSALSQMASTDELTGLSNRRRFTESLHVEMARLRRVGGALSLVMADVDHLKKINDAHGHPGGDAAIRHVAEAFQRGRRETDVAARLGGEEFALLLPATDRVGAAKAAERIRRELAGSSVPGIGTVTVSIGVATAPEDAPDEQELVRVADERLYAAKSAGRNQVCYLSLSVPLKLAAAHDPVKPA